MQADRAGDPLDQVVDFVGQLQDAPRHYCIGGRVPPLHTTQQPPGLRPLGASRPFDPRFDPRVSEARRLRCTVIVLRGPQGC
jgi:hypothetical protein